MTFIDTNTVFLEILLLGVYSQEQN